MSLDQDLMAQDLSSNMNKSDEHGLAIIRAYVEGQAKLGYARFSPEANSNDIILATYPKSGSTWTSYLMHQIRSSGSDDFDDIKNEVVDITPGHWLPEKQPFTMVQKYTPGTFKTHGSYALCPKGARYIYVSRDPKDIFLSLYQFIHDLLGIEEKVSIDRFYQEYFIDRFDSGHDIGNVWGHILGWHQLHHQEDMLWLHYEDIVQSRQQALHAIAMHMGVELDDKLMALLLQHSAMEHMRGISKKINSSPNNYVGKIVAGFGDLTNNYARKMAFGKMRKGIPGEGKKELPDELMQDMDDQWRQRITPGLGYANYAELRMAHPLPQPLD